MTKYIKNLAGLTRAQASMVFQLRTEHIPLNKYLHRIKKSETNKCTACPQITGSAATESVRHFLFECPAYNNERRRLDAKLGRNSKDLKAILANPEHIKDLMQFIGQTERFKPSLGDLTKIAKPSLRQQLIDFEKSLRQ
jgi:3-methyladenine DNA glycosylase Tag